jgi:Sulfotransferase domain
MKCFVVSLHRCGTRSTAAFLNELGIRTRHWPVEHGGVDLQEMIRGRETDAAYVTTVLEPVIESYDAVADVPIPVLYRELFARYPEAKFLLLYRDPFDWIQSVRWKLRRGDFQPYVRVQYWTYFPRHPERIGDLTDEELVWMHGQHRNEVLAYFGRVAPDQLGVFDLDASDTSQRVASFLGVESARPFPHHHSRRRGRDDKGGT